jgi:antitoxin ChpS
MYKTSLRKVGGSVMLAVPPALLEVLELRSGAVVGLEVRGESLVIQPQRRPVYTLEQLLKDTVPDAPLTEEDRQWLDAPSVGNEL